jgi:hypothetical protein
MLPTCKKINVISLGLSAILLCSEAVVLAINPSATGTSNGIAYADRFLAITEVSYEIGGVASTQLTEVTSGVSQQTQPVYVTQVVAGGRTLDFFNFEGARLRDINQNFDQSNITTAQTGIGTVNHTGFTAASAGKVAFDNSLAATTQNNDILDYIYYDGAGTTPSAAFDFDMLFKRGLEPNDAFLIQERNGNTYFKLNPLGADGNVIAGANTLVFGGTSDTAAGNTAEEGGTPLTRYDWNSGYTLANYQEDQPIVFTVTETSLFFEGTSVAMEDQVVYGFRIDNNGNADVKFFGLSDDPFDNNPLNPIDAVPEPSAFAMLLGIAALLLTGRRRPARA